MQAKPATIETEEVSVSALVAAFGRLALAVECTLTKTLRVIFLTSPS
jgi:hypothetical protein